MSRQFYQGCFLTVAVFSFATAAGCDNSGATTNAQVPLNYASRNVPVLSGSSFGSIHAETVVSQQRQLKEICDQLSAAEREVTSLRTKIFESKSVLSQIPGEIDRMQRDVGTIEELIPAAEAALAKARETYVTFSKCVPGLKRQVISSADQARVAEYDRAASQISRERSERNELRASIGARPEDQSEAQKEYLKLRDAKQVSDSRYASAIRSELSAIGARLEDYRSRVTLAKNRLNDFQSRTADISRKIKERQETLRGINDFLVTAPSQLDSLEREVDRLVGLKNHQEATLLVTRKTLYEIVEASAAARAVERAQAATLASPVTWQGSSSPMNREVVPSRTQFRWTSLPSTRSTTRYDDATYRPAAGHQYVSGHVRRNGTYVPGHYRTRADDSYWNNWSAKGNVNPYTGKRGTSSPGYGR